MQKNMRERGMTTVGYLVLLALVCMLSCGVFAGNPLFKVINKTFYGVTEMFGEKNPFAYEQLVQNIRSKELYALPTADLLIRQGTMDEYLLKDAEVVIPSNAVDWLYLGSGSGGYQVLWTGVELGNLQPETRVKAMLADSGDKENYYTVYAEVDEQHRLAPSDTTYGMYDVTKLEAQDFAGTLMDYRNMQDIKKADYEQTKESLLPMPKSK